MHHSHRSRRPRHAIALAIGLAAVLALACGGGLPDGPNGSQGSGGFTDVPPPPGGVAQFTVLPTAIAPGLTLTALGNLNPPGHVLPTDHVYMYDWDLSTRPAGGTDVRDVLMPATGAVFLVLSNGGPASKVMFRVTSGFYFYLDGVVLSQPLAVGQIVTAGTKLGATIQGSTLDLGAFDTSAVHPGFLNRARYPFQTLYCVSPWKYFSPELQAQIYPHMYRAPAAADRDGKIDFGISGKLAGDWFLQTMPIDSSWQPYGWTRTLSFAYDYYDPSQVRISIGGTVGPAGVWAIDSTAPRPETVTPASGVVPYLLYSQFDKGFPPYGLLLVQMLDSATIKAQLFVGVTMTNRQFDATATTFVR